MASVRKRPWTYKGVTKQTWVVTYTNPNTKKRIQAGTFQSKKEAEECRKHIEHRLKLGLLETRYDRLTLPALELLFSRELEVRVRADDFTKGAMVAYNQNAKNHINPYFKMFTADKITVMDVKEFIAFKARTLARSTVNKLVVHLGQILQHGVERELLTKNVVRGTRYRIPLPMAEEVRIPTLAQLQGLVVSLEQPTVDPARRAFVYLALFGGLRLGEATALQWQHIDQCQRRMSIQASWNAHDGLKRPKTRSGIREVAVAEPLSRALAALWLERHKPTEGFLFPARMSALQRQRNFAYKVPAASGVLRTRYWEPAAAAASLRREDGTLFNYHSLRHAAVSLWLRAEMPVLEVKKMIGHSNVQMTMNVYAHLFKDESLSRRVKGVDGSATLLLGIAS